jgi:2-succinyl-6-hydroxy-2,4-cyclohexadiene-1-carboxylate synthase
MLLHGFTGSGRSMASVAQALEGDYDCIAPDLPGHGRSWPDAAPAAGSFDACLDSLVATLEAQGHGRAHWLGYSMGARLALGCAVRHPGRVASLVLLGARAGIAGAAERAGRRRADEALAVRIEQLGAVAFIDEWLAQPLFETLRRRGPDFLASERRARLGHEPRGLAASLRGLGPGAQPPLFEELHRVQVPVLLVAGALDRPFVAAARDLAKRLPHAELLVIDDAGHAAHVEQPQAFMRAVREFLHRVDGPVRASVPLPAQETAS